MQENEIIIPVTCRGEVEVPSVSSVIDTKFPASKYFNERLYRMAVTDDKNLWMGGESRELKSFEPQGHLLRTATIIYSGMNICMHNKHVVFNDLPNKTLKKRSLMTTL